MSSITQPVLRRHSIEFLKKHYESKTLNQRYYHGYIEPTATGMYAEGFLAFRTKDHMPYIVAISTSASVGLLRFFGKITDGQWARGAFLTGLVLTLLGNAVCFITKAPIISYVATSVLLFALGMVAFSLIFKKSPREREVATIEKLQDVPANERWICFAKEVFDKLKKDDQTEYLKLARIKGVGILIVSGERNFNLLREPRAIKSTDEELLAKYKNVGNILSSI